MTEEPAWSSGISSDDTKALQKAAKNHLVQQGEKPHPKKLRRLIGGVTKARDIREAVAMIEEPVGAQFMSHATLSMRHP